MNNSAKIVLWLGLFMILAGIVRNWSTFSATLFGGPTSTGPPGGVQHTPVPASGKCPAGYTKISGNCVWVQPLNPAIGGG